MKEGISLIQVLLIAGIVAISGCVASGPYRTKVPQSPNIPVNFPVEEIGIELPKEDVQGEDLPDVPRYSPSVRTSYDKSDSSGYYFTISIEYYTEENVDNVRDFYLREMPKLGWRFVREEAEPGVTFYGFKVKGSRSMEFTKGECENYDYCFPHVSITLGGFKIGEKEYTTIGIDYEDERAEAKQEGKEEEEEKPTPVTPPTQFGNAFNELFAPIISSVSGEATLTSYDENNVMGVMSVMATYTLSSPVSDVSNAAGGIKSGLEEKGVPSSAISVSVSGGSATVTVSSMEIKGKSGMVTIDISANSNKISITWLSYQTSQ